MKNEVAFASETVVKGAPGVAGGCRKLSFLATPAAVAKAIFFEAVTSIVKPGAVLQLQESEPIPHPGGQVVVTGVPLAEPSFMHSPFEVATNIFAADPKHTTNSHIVESEIMAMVRGVSPASNRLPEFVPGDIAWVSLTCIFTRSTVGSRSWKGTGGGVGAGVRGPDVVL